MAKAPSSPEQQPAQAISEAAPAAPPPAAAASTSPPPAAAAPAAPSPDAAPPTHRGGAGGVIVVLLLAILALGLGAAAGWIFYLPKHPIPALANLKIPFMQRAGPATAGAAHSAAARPPVVAEAPPGPAPGASPPPAASSASAAPASSASAAPIAVASGAPPANSAQPPLAAGQVQADAAGLVADARRAGLPRDQIGALTAANSRLAGAVDADGAAMAMARNEAALLARISLARQREVDATLGSWGGGSGSVGAVHRARANLAAAIAAVYAARDGGSALAAARRAVAVYPMFANAYATATRDYAPGKRALFAAVANQARGAAAQVVADASEIRSGAFATTGRRAAYEELQANAVRANGLMSELNMVASYEAYESDPRRLDGQIARATEIRETVMGLYASSSALYQANK